MGVGSAIHWAECTFALQLPGQELTAKVRVPEGRVRVVDLLPVLQSLEDAIIASTVRQVERRGRRISCGPGCPACCCHMVPLSVPEAIWISDVVEAMAPARRERVRARFASALERLEQTGMLERIRNARSLASVEYRRQVGADYFNLHVPCPFLEDASCGIHPDRPLMCREYLVISPAELCIFLYGRVVRVSVPASMAHTLFHFGNGSDGKPRVVPLILALEWAERHRGNVPRFPGRELFEAILGRLTLSELPNPCADHQG